MSRDSLGLNNPPYAFNGGVASQDLVSQAVTQVLTLFYENAQADRIFLGFVSFLRKATPPSVWHIR